MSIVTKETFIGEKEADVRTHILDVIKARPTGDERRAGIAYLRQIVAADQRLLREYKSVNAEARRILEDRENEHRFDIRPTKHGIFTVATNVNYQTLLAADNAEIVADGVAINTGMLTIAGDYASLTGSGPGRRLVEL